MKNYLLSCLCVLLWTASLSAATINVTPGSGTFKTAVNAAKAGDTLLLTTGEYTESSTLRPTVALTIRATEGTQPVLKLSSRIEIKAD